MAQQGIVLRFVDNATWQDFLLLFLIFWFLIAQTYYIRFSYYRIDCIHDMLHNLIYDYEDSQEQAKIVRIAGDMDDLMNYLREQGFEVDNLVEENELQSNIDAIREWDMS